jgi:hypothetical protein
MTCLLKPISLTLCFGTVRALKETKHKPVISCSTNTEGVGLVSGYPSVMADSVRPMKFTPVYVSSVLCFTCPCACSRTCRALPYTH